MQYTLEEVNVSKSFWIIWQPESEKPPTVRFDTFAKAETVAKQMAVQYDRPFYVMRGSALVEPPQSLARVTVLV